MLLNCYYDDYDERADNVVRVDCVFIMTFLSHWCPLLTNPTIGLYMIKDVCDTASTQSQHAAVCARHLLARI